MPWLRKKWVGTHRHGVTSNFSLNSPFHCVDTIIISPVLSGDRCNLGDMMGPELHGLPSLQAFNGFRVVFQYTEIKFALPKHLESSHPDVLKHNVRTSTKTQLNMVPGTRRFVSGVKPMVASCQSVIQPNPHLVRMHAEQFGNVENQQPEFAV